MSRDAAPLSGTRRRLEALAVSLLGGLLLFVSARYGGFGLLMGPAYAVLLMPSVIERWRAPIVGFMPGFLAFQWIIHQPLAKFAWWVPYLLFTVLSLHYVLQPLLARALKKWTSLPAWIVLPLAVAVAEWTRPMFGVGSYNMFEVGTFLYAWPILTQAAEFVGALGLSVLWMIPFAYLVDWLRRRS